MTRYLEVIDLTGDEVRVVIHLEDELSEHRPAALSEICVVCMDKQTQSQLTCGKSLSRFLDFCFRQLTVYLGHRFCRLCVLIWAQTQADSGLEMTCPLCRRTS